MSTSRKPKLGESAEVAVFAPHLRELALELPRSYRKQAIERLERHGIDIANPGDQDDVARQILTSLATVYQRKSAHIRHAAATKRIDAYMKQHEAEFDALINELL